MVLEPFGRSTWGWEQNSLITVDPETKEFICNPEFYVMKHFSHFIKPGAVRLETNGPWTGNAVAFRNPDGSSVVVISNPFERKSELCIGEGNESYRVELEPSSFNTFVL